MGRIKKSLISIFMTMVMTCIFLFTGSVSAANSTPYEYKTSYGVTIVSYSPSWKSQVKLKALGDELLNNGYGEELSYLSKIIIYADSPYGVSGYYTDDVRVSGSKLSMGKNCYIELYSGEKNNTVDKLANTLSHEYGHHFTLYHIVKTENKYYHEWSKTRYAALRNANQYSQVQYEVGDQYDHAWDIAEIAANDYVQLLGSPKAKQSEKYKDLEDIVAENLSQYSYTAKFNMYPQENLSLPLAAQVEGLFSYFASFTKNTPAAPRADIKPTGLSVSVENEDLKGYPLYAITWNRLQGSYEYTAVMYPQNDFSDIEAIKTVLPVEEMKGFFGTKLYQNKDGTFAGFIQKYTGAYTFRVFAKDTNGYVYASDPFNVNF